LKHTWLLLAIATIFIANAASAGFFLGYYGDDFYFEIGSGNTYSYSATPYSYYYDDWYYFDYPYRVYSYGDYHYFEPGWYTYDDYFVSQPYSSYYSYYPSDYYYYNSYWNYYPGWVNSYAPTYYGAYYYPPAAYDVHYAPVGNYPETTGVLTGQHYHPTQRADCGEVTLTTSTVRVNSGYETRTVFYINNYASMDLDIENVYVYVDGFDVDASNISHGGVVRSNSTEMIKFDTSAEYYVPSQSRRATINVTGTFRDGTRCNAADLEKDFYINVNGASYQEPQIEECLYGSGAYCNSQGSTSYTVARETQQEWVEIEPEPLPEPEPVETINTYYDEPQLPVANCNSLSLGEENMVVESGGSKTAYFTFRNYSTENFHIDNIEATDYSPDFGVEAYREISQVYSGQTTTVKVRVHGETNEDSTGTAFITVNGHFNSGLTCTLASDTFYVRVNGKEERASLDVIKVNNPAKVEVSGTAGFVSFQVDNPSDEIVAIRVYSNDVLVSPKEFRISPNSLAERLVTVNGLEEAEGTIFFDIQAEDREYLQKYTKLLRVASQPFEEEVQTQVVEIHIPIEEPTEQTEEPEGLDGFMATGFGFLSDNAFLLGIILVVLLAGILLVSRE